MIISSFDWGEANLSHATRHGISAEEIEEAILGAVVVRKGGSGVYLAYGRTLDGRYVLALFQDRSRGVARPFSARPMTRGEKSRIRRRMR